MWGKFVGLLQPRSGTAAKVADILREVVELRTGVQTLEIENVPPVHVKGRGRKRHRVSVQLLPMLDVVREPLVNREPALIRVEARAARRRRLVVVLTTILRTNPVRLVRTNVWSQRSMAAVTDRDTGQKAQLLNRVARIDQDQVRESRVPNQKSLRDLGNRREILSERSPIPEAFSVEPLRLLRYHFIGRKLRHLRLQMSHVSLHSSCQEDEILKTKQPICQSAACLILRRNSHHSHCHPLPWSA